MNTEMEFFGSKGSQGYETKLYRIRALKSFGTVKEGDLGGFVENESNLSQTGDAWVSGDALVYGYAEVSGEANVSGEVNIGGNAIVESEVETRD